MKGRERWFASDAGLLIQVFRGSLLGFGGAAAKWLRQ